MMYSELKPIWENIFIGSGFPNSQILRVYDMSKVEGCSGFHVITGRGIQVFTNLDDVKKEYPYVEFKK